MSHVYVYRKNTWFHNDIPICAPVDQATTPSFRSKLLAKIPDDTYDVMMVRLNDMRQQHPSYRDDELLMALWYECISGA